MPDGSAPKSKGEVETNSDQPIQKFDLPNGLRLLVKEDHRLPFVEFRAAFKGGVLAETTANNGITQLLAKTLLKGTPTRTAEKIATEIESVGGSIDSYGGNNSFGVNAEVLSSDFATGLDLLADVLLNPIFPAGELEREREVQIAGIYAHKDDLLKSASLAMRRATVRRHRLRPRFARHGRNRSRNLQADDLKSFHQKLVDAEQLRARHLRRREGGRSQSRRGKGVCELETERRERRHLPATVNTLSTRRQDAGAPSASRKPATRSRPCWSSVSPARRWTTTTVTRWS